MKLEAKIEGLLFYRAEPISVDELAKLFKVSKDEIETAVRNLSDELVSRGIMVVRAENDITLGTSPELSTILEEIKKEELNKELSKASIETLAIVLYKNGATRGEIDYVRGVNSSFILRALQVRGLVERVVHPTDSRKYVYKPTIDLLRLLGVSKIQDLPDYESSITELTNAFSGSSENLE